MKREINKKELKLRTSLPEYHAEVLSVPRGSGEKIGIRPEWKEKYRRDTSIDAIGMTRVDSFKDIDAETLTAKRNARARKKRRNKMIYIAIQSVLFAVMLIAVAKLGENYKSNVEGTEHRAEISRLIAGDSTQTVYATPERSVPAYPIATPERIVYPVDEMPTLAELKKLKEINEDFVCWLYIPGTEVSYYVLQGDDNAEYLRADINHNYLHSGSCFLDYRNNARTMAGHTIIYGHTMNDLSIFGELRNYLTEDFYNTHRYFYTCSTENVTMWRIFSVYITTVDEYYIETYFRNKDVYLEFINGLNSGSIYPSDTNLVATDDVLTFSTCYRLFHGADGRLVVHAVKVGTTPIA